MDIVCASPTAHQFGSVPGIRRSFWGGSGDGSAVYLERLRDIVYYVVVEYRYRGVFWF